ncbi:hypothetical protein HMPREF3039_01298 [Akkermansia sp. KLE1798]|nr:hypothetical protein HMPREF3039_01298 [Akkermansia sp. KLE1798]KZA04798.1 hypothetical protein HMPREF1326_01375 [Akkermansia sp. KLE1605]
MGCGWNSHAAPCSGFAGGRACRGGLMPLDDCFNSFGINGLGPEEQGAFSTDDGRNGADARHHFN